MLVACFLMLLILVALQRSWDLINNSQYNQDTLVTARQQVRSALNEIVDGLRNSENVWTSVNGSINLKYAGNSSNSVTFNYNYAPGTGSQDPNWGPPLPVVSPAVQTQLFYASPDSNGGTTFTVHALYLRNRVPVDPRVPGAQQICLWSQQFVTPPVSGAPASIVLTSLPAGSGAATPQLKVFDAYIPQNGFQIFVDATGTAVEIEGEFALEFRQGNVASGSTAGSRLETFFTEACLRNHP
jgi:hypothetical protein